MQVNDILRVKGGTLFTVAPDSPLADAVTTMADRDIGSLVVMEFGEMVGMLTFREVMKMEFRIVSRVLDGVDFYEGVRAAVIDKDQAPRWTPATLEQLDMEEIEAYFAPLHHELELPQPARL